MKPSLAVGPSCVIFTDMDGTLLDHHTYSWQAAQPAIELAHQYHVPIIPCTSKTIPETLALTQKIGLDGPIIGENGSGYWLDGELFPIGDSVDTLLQKLAVLRSDHGFSFVGMSEMSLEQIVQFTGLDNEGAKLAKQRNFSEPFIWQENSAERLALFTEAASRVGIDIIRGGRFYHAMSRGVSKGNTMHALLETTGLKKNNLQKPGTNTNPVHQNPNVIALGDSDNDISMLQAADVAVVVNNPTRTFPLMTSPQGDIEYTSDFGPQGWNTAILNILETYHG